MWKTFDEQVPRKNGTWIKVFIPHSGNKEGEFYGSTGWEYFVEMKDGIAILATNETLEYVYPAGEEGITHWKTDVAQL